MTAPLPVLHDFGDDEPTNPDLAPRHTLVLDGLPTQRMPAFVWGRLPRIPYVERYPPQVDGFVEITLLDLGEALFLEELERGK